MMISTPYGYVTPEEAEVDARLDKWIERKRRNQHAKDKKMPLS